MNALKIMPLARHSHTTSVLPHQLGETVSAWLILELLLLFLICAIASFLVSKLAKDLFPSSAGGGQSLELVARTSRQEAQRLKQ